nr:DUF1661 domain-containing protein [Porphyromonas sp. COT-052 OH4946]
MVFQYPVFIPPILFYARDFLCVWHPKTWFAKIFVLAREVKILRAGTKKISRAFSRFYGRQFHHFRLQKSETDPVESPQKVA